MAQPAHPSFHRLGSFHRLEGLARQDYRPIDLVHLAKQSLGDRSLECEVLRAFDQVVQVYYERVRAARTVQELAERLRLLKAAARGVGARPVCELARMAEAECRAGFRLDEEELDDLGMAVEEVRAFIAELLVGQD
jgi:hypothetical protein